MSSANAAGQRDPESLEISLINISIPPPPKLRLRHILLALRASVIFHSIFNSIAKRSLSPTAQARVSSSAATYTTFNTHNAADVSIPIDSDQILLVNIAKMVKDKDLGLLNEFGGVEGIAAALCTHLQDGLGEETYNLHQINPNAYNHPQSTQHSCFHFVLEACNNFTIPLLVICAVLLFGFGIKEEGLQKGWYDGAIVLLSVLVLVSATSVGNWWRARMFNKQLKEKEITCLVVRDGKRNKISISDVLVGDIICLKIGDQVPADGLFVDGESLLLNDMPESIINAQNPFVFDGTEVINGHGLMLATSCGKNTALSEIMSLVSTHHGDPNKKTPLQKKLDKVNACTQVITLLISILILVALFLRHELGKTKDDESGRPDVKGKSTDTHEFLNALEKILIRSSRGPINTLIPSLAVFLVGLQEGLPLVITLSIAHWSNKVASNKATVQELLACVTMGSVTTICIDKIGTMFNQLEVDMFRVGEDIITSDSVIDTNVCDALCHGICTPVIVPHTPYSSIDDTSMYWAGSKFGMKMENLRESFTVIETKRLNSAEEASSVLMKKSEDNGMNLYIHWKGHAATILGMCSHHFNSEGAIIVIDERRRMEFENIIDDMVGAKKLKTIAFAYKETNDPLIEESNLILIGLLGLKKKPLEETMKTMKAIRNAGVNIKLISGEEVALQEVIANECGMLMPINDRNRMKLEGKDFRSCTDKERMEMVDQVSIMENALPSDKVLLVKCLKQKGHVVAVIGGVRTIETPPLKEADVGLAMGAWSTKMTRESSDIIIWYDICNFLINVLTCGRCVYCNIQKFIQLELTMIIAELLIITITAISSGDSAITAFQVFFVNLTVPFFGGLSLLTEPPTEKLMDKPPVSRTATLITKAMWRNILIQSIYQAAILVVFQFKGQAILGINEKVCKTMIFNSFVICQVFNQFNARELEKKYVFEGINENYWFRVGVVSQVALQVAFVEILGLYSITASLNFVQWGICSVIGMVALVIDLVGKCISDISTDWIIRSLNTLSSHLWVQLGLGYIFIQLEQGLG